MERRSLLRKLRLTPTLDMVGGMIFGGQDARVSKDVGAGWDVFFTVNLLQRRGNDLLVRHVDALRAAVRTTGRDHPFTIHARVVLPEHLHCVIELPHRVRWAE